MRFASRTEAGEKLAAALATRTWRKPLVVSLPRGGCVLGAIVAKVLDAGHDIVTPRKIGAEDNPEWSVGAITEAGDAIWDEGARVQQRPEYLEERIKEEQAEARRRLKLFRGDRGTRQVAGHDVIVVDDGMATGETMLAALKTLRNEGPESLTVAVPVSSREAAERAAEEAEHVVILSVPKEFGAVGTYYEDFPQVTDQEVVKLLKA